MDVREGDVPSDVPLVVYSSFDDLYNYCYHVASVVGLVCIRIFGYRDPIAEKHAEHLGIAFQLTNILRDVKEDAAMVASIFRRKSNFGPWSFRRAVHPLLTWLLQRSITFHRHRLQHAASGRGAASFEGRVGFALGKEGKW